jgi:hypothetical protein
MTNSITGVLKNDIRLINKVDKETKQAIIEVTCFGLALLYVIGLILSNLHL